MALSARERFDPQCCDSPSAALRLANISERQDFGAKSLMADHLRTSLALDALEMALASREVVAGGLVHHSDRGIQYACGDYIARLETAGIQPSMSRAGCPYDKAMAESFMKTLTHARAAVGEFIETAYNRQRLHSALAYLSPVEFESNQPWAAAQQPRAVTQLSCP